MQIRFFLIFVVCLITKTVSSQNLEQCKPVEDFNTWISLDSLTILPGSAMVTGLDSSSYSIEYNTSSGTLLVRYDGNESNLEVCYKTLPISLHERYYNRSLEVYDSNAIFEDPVESSAYLPREELFATQDLYKSGSISRGISFGNNQDVFVNSTLNLNLDGKLTEDLNIRASITDQNIPFQPQGNTQQLQDFDNVFIEIYNENVSLTGGDVVLQDRSSYFLQYYKNVQGAFAKVNYSLSDNDEASTSVGVSVAKGRFASVQIPSKEGLLGPYRINGPNGEQFVIILANSERVFLDGKQLKRGFNNDYVIDYNTAELTFTNKVLITQFSRIRVDYEYSDQDYNRTIVAAKHDHKIGKFNIGVSAYSEKDNRNRPLLVDLTNEDKELLSMVGDSLNRAVTSGADSVGYVRDQIRYLKADTLVGNRSYTIFKQSNNPELAIYKVTFSEVGTGNGNYVQLQSTANGRVYSWVAPIGGIPQGNYAPFIDLPVPDNKQMVAINSEYKATEFETIYSEIAFSSQDVNLFSELDDEDDSGYALKAGVRSSGRHINFLPEYNVSFYTDFEFDNENFKPIDRFREIEYNRDWSVNSVNQQVSDKIFNAGVGFEKDQNNLFHYRYSIRQRPNTVDGHQHALDLNKRLGNFNIRSNAFLLKNELSKSTSEWKRISADISYDNKYLVPGYQYNIDQNRVLQSENDSVTSSAMYFDEHVYYLKNHVGADWDFRLQHAVRQDGAPLEGEIKDFTMANTSQLTIGKDLGDDRLDLSFTYREVEQQQLDETEEYISGRVDWSGVMLDNHIRSDMTYAISNSQELRKEFVYVKVPTGEGTHTWRDLNNDGIQDLNEFFEAINPDEKNYVKIFTPTNEFITAFQTLFVYNVNISAPRTWRSSDGVRGLLSKLSNSTSWSADTKTTEDNIGDRIFAFARNIQEESLLSERNVLRSTTFFNRANAKYGMEFTFFNTAQKQLLVNGFESLNNESYDLNLRYNLSLETTLKLRGKRGIKNSDSDFLEGRNYLIDSYQFNPEFAWQPKNNFRLSLQYNYTEKYNNLTNESSESTFFNELICGLRINNTTKSTLNTQFSWSEINFKGKENSPIGYDLLNALRPGTNLSWSVNWQQKIINGLQLNLTYDGRKSEDVDTIHVGRVQISALF